MLFQQSPNTFLFLFVAATIYPFSTQIKGELHLPKFLFAFGTNHELHLPPPLIVPCPWALATLLHSERHRSMAGGWPLAQPSSSCTATLVNAPLCEPPLSSPQIGCYPCRHHQLLIVIDRWFTHACLDRTRSNVLPGSKLGTLLEVEGATLDLE